MKIQNIAFSLALFGLAACASENDETALVADVETSVIATAPIKNAEGGNVGLASIVSEADSLLLKVSLSNMPSGTKALHFHTTGACEAPDFKSAGSHLNPESVTHGQLSETGPHLGDFPNVEIADDGLAEISLEIAGTANAMSQHILDEDGTAIMIHAGPDDYKSDPAGAAGPRIACGVFETAVP